MTEEEALLALFSNLPRQGPGDDTSTRRALALIPDLPDSARILDCGCGEGAQTITLAQACPDAQIEAIDLFPQFLQTLNTRAQAANVAEHIRTHEGSMGELAFPLEHFDLIWSEGAAYSIGVGEALTHWRSFLKPGGHVALTELCWLTETPPDEARSFFAREYPMMGGLSSLKDIAETTGYRVCSDFTLPPYAWTDNYYTPLRQRVEALTSKDETDPDLAALLNATRAEIDLYESYGDSYGYIFIILQRQD